MKRIFLFLSAVAFGVSACHKDNGHGAQGDPNKGTSFSIEGDQVGRPGLNIVFISDSDHDLFNQTEPSKMAAVFGAQIRSKLLALNPDYTVNKIGLDADQFAGALTTDVLNVSLTGKTTYYDGTHVLTGRTLDEDVIDDNLTFIFGGPGGTDKPGLSSDHVDHNDKAFLSSFPYEAAPW